MKTTRTKIGNLDHASFRELSNEEMIQATGGSDTGTLSFGTTSWTGSWGMMDVDGPIYDSSIGGVSGGIGHIAQY